MAKIHVRNKGGNRFGGVPYGNVSVEYYNITAKANGSIEGSSTVTAPQANDVLILGTLEQGFRLDDAQIIVKTPMTTGITADIGFVYADGVNDVKVPQDAAYFASGANLATAGRLRASTAKLVCLPKDAFLTVTIKGAANAKSADIDILISGEKFGNL
jgi:putative phage structural protein|nr:MAG TPA: hypothetical protein [Caudoviricetes sp.]